MIQIIVAGAVCVIIGGLFWMVFTIAPSAMISVMGMDSFRDDAQTTVNFMNAAIIAIPILVGLACLAFGVNAAIQERELGQVTL